MKKLLIIIGATVGLNTSIIAGPIHDAAATGDIEAVQAELDKGVDVDLKDDTTEITPLYRAALNGHKQIVELLIASGADLEAKNYFRGAAGKATNGATAVFAALNNKEIMTLLIVAGADLNVKTITYKETILHILASRDESESNLEIIDLVINNGADVNAMTVAHIPATPRVTVSRGVGTPKDIALFNQNFVIAELLQKYGGKTTSEVIESLQNKTVALEKLISEKHKADTTNPTDEWPRKMWEVEFGIKVIGVGPRVERGADNALFFTIFFENGDHKYWVTSSGKHYQLEKAPSGNYNLIYVSNDSVVYEEGDLIIGLFSNNEEVAKRTFKKSGLTDADYDDPFGPTVQVSWEGSKVTGWDFTPPSSTKPNPDGSNEGGGGRLIIKTAGPDIALATDGKLGGAAELQKSNDLRSWRKLVDVPAEASEVLVTPRESGNEFYRLKKK